MGVRELVDQARLAYAGLADERRHLPVTVAGELLGAAELLQLGVAADEAGQAAPGGHLQAGPPPPPPPPSRRPQPGQRAPSPARGPVTSPRRSPRPAPASRA